jgi:alanine racemase
MEDWNTGRPTWAEIDLVALQSNYRVLRRRLREGTQLMAVVKADAYGHGAVRCALALEEIGADWFGVALPEEGEQLRSGGISRPIFCVGGFWRGQAERLIAHRIVPAVFRLDALEELDARARAVGEVAEFHLKVDTGMGRLGIGVGEIAAWMEALPTFPNARLAGLLTHFADADGEDRAVTQRQMTIFERIGRTIEAVAGPIRWRHLANSAGLYGFPDAHGTLARAGASLYGLVQDVLPSAEVPAALEELRPVLSLHTRIILLKRVASGVALGYGGTYRTSRESLIATLPIGYADGLRRHLSNRGHVLISGQRAPIVGRVSMDLTLVDVTDVAGVEVGDAVVVLGSSVPSDGASLAIRAEHLAAEIGTISYEVLTGIGARVPRRYVLPTD